VLTAKIRQFRAKVDSSRQFRENGRDDSESGPTNIVGTALQFRGFGGSFYTLIKSSPELSTGPLDHSVLMWRTAFRHAISGVRRARNR
jgi:hypothetical protein